ncbi:hypothetical protein F1737_05385 [Methanoplanus sp. FWC-SCC4]|uniref:Uncharacterized protein n=1 Tax=Methanochimaera problematica TaxID=2609417 RepID=A0AA97FDR6_9EURY|nr:hypothetical protein [Methanoplanus sp. FWC-SCC4]WOF16178.1 hypothetical protein F1737_05385 [Methanoplanus sp. FWC-SCC4]
MTADDIVEISYSNPDGSVLTNTYKGSYAFLKLYRSLDLSLRQKLSSGKINVLLNGKPVNYSNIKTRAAAEYKLCRQTSWVKSRGIITA